jgi:hypothetical protein
MTARDLLIAAALVLGCGSVPTGNPKVDGLAWSICEEYDVLCGGSTTKEDFPGTEEYLSDFYWGRASYGEIEIPVLEETVPYDLICWDDVKCAEDLTTCAGVLLHEVGHTRVGVDQVQADCWAFAHATEAEGAALTELICSWGESTTRCQTLRGGCDLL